MGVPGCGVTMMKLQPSTKKLIGLIVFLPALLIYLGLVVTFAAGCPSTGLFIWSIMSSPERSGRSR